MIRTILPLIQKWKRCCQLSTIVLGRDYFGNWQYLISMRNWNMYNPSSFLNIQTRFQEFNYLLFFLFSHDQSLEVILLSSSQYVVIFSSRCSFVYSRPWRRSSCEPWHLERYSSVITVRWRWQLYHLVLFVFCIYSSDNLQLDLTSLGASELTRYDFGHCSIDKVFLLALFDPELSLHCLDRGNSSELHS